MSEGSFEAAEADALLALVRPGDLFVDVGANAGLYAVAMAVRGAEVVAFEPLPRYQALLVQNAALNGTHVEVVPKAVAEHSGERSFHVTDDGGFSSLAPTRRRPERDRISVPCTTLDDELLPRQRQGGVWKVDVEGAELLALLGASRLLGNPLLRPRAILVELNEQNQAAFGYTPYAVVKHLAGFGYEAHSITPGGVVRRWPVPGGSEDVLFVPTGSATAAAGSGGLE